jgi:hypothetical protein
MGHELLTERAINGNINMTETKAQKSPAVRVGCYPGL